MSGYEPYQAGAEGNVLVVVAPATLTQEGADDLRASIARDLPAVPGAAVVIDLSGTGMITSLGIAALLQAQEFCRDRGAGFILAGLTQANRKFLTMLRLEQRFDQADTPEDAIRLVEQGHAGG